MKANEFVKKFGWEEAKIICNGVFTGVVCYKWVELNIDDLKRLVESHELVESFSIIGLCSPENNYNPCIDYEKFGGLPMAKRELSEAIKYNSEFIEIIFDNEITLIETERLKQSIADVESCQ